MPSHSKVMEAVYLTRDTQMGRSKFLTDESNAERLVKFASLSESDHVCELGAGFGVLSKQILKEKVKSLLSIEWNRLCTDHLAKFPNYHNNHIVKHGDPFFIDFCQEYEFMKHELNPNLTVFVCSATKSRNPFFIDQFMEDLVYQKQLFSFPLRKIKIITLVESNKAKRICGNDEIPGSIYDLLPQNYFQIELGPTLQPNVFTDAEDSSCTAIKLIPLSNPRLNLNFASLKQLINYMGGSGYSKFSKRTIRENLIDHGVLNSQNKDLVFEIFDNLHFDLDTKQRDISFIDIVKFANALHLFPPV